MGILNGGGPSRLRLGVVCGLAAEAACLGALARDPRVAVAVSGARPEAAAAAARALAARGAGFLLSFGVAGGLDPALAPGAPAVPRVVLDAQGARFACAPLARVAAGALLGVEQVVATPAEKAALRAATGAATLDMESARVARVAAAAGLPFAALRAVADPAGRALPPLARDAVGPDGRTRLGVVAGGLLRRPGDLPGLIALGRDFAAARAALRALAAQSLPALLDALER